MTDSTPAPDTRTYEQRFLDEVLPLAERKYPGISATVEREIARDRAQEEVRAYVRPSNVSAVEWEASHRVMLERMRSAFVNQVEALIAADAAALLGAPKADAPNFNPVSSIRGGAAVARELALAEQETPKEAAWKAVTSNIEKLYREFCDVPNFPRLPKLQAELAWRKAAAAAGVGGLKRIRELRGEIEDAGGTFE